MCQMELLKSKVLCEWLWNIHQVNEIYQSTAQITGKLIEVFSPPPFSVTGANTQGKLLLSARISLLSGALL